MNSNDDFDPKADGEAQRERDDKKNKEKYNKREQSKDPEFNDVIAENDRKKNDGIRNKLAIQVDKNAEIKQEIKDALADMDDNTQEK